MARTKKEFEGKRDALLLSIWDIFVRNGYENTTLSLIISELSISKGVFYHYFHSKEECADAAIDMFIDRCIERIQAEELPGLTPDQKLTRMILSGVDFFHSDRQQAIGIDAPSNAVFHEKLMIAAVKRLAPVFARMIEQGVAEQIFSTEHPLESAEMILTLSNFYLDDVLFHWNPETIPDKIRAVADSAERILGAKKGTFRFLCFLPEGRSAP